MTSSALVFVFGCLSTGISRPSSWIPLGALARRWLAGGSPAPIVLNRDGRAVRVERDGNVRRVAVHRLVDRVVEDLPDEVVQARRADAADVHPRPAPDGLEALEDGDVFGGVGRHEAMLVHRQGNW